MKLRKRALFWITAVVTVVSILTTSGIALASVPMVNSNAATYPMAATAPSLGEAESFAVLGHETVTNTGPTALTGDLGLYPGTAISGFYGTAEDDGPGTVDGDIHQTDAVAQQAQSGANNAYINLADQPSEVDLTGDDLGGLTLTPGVYTFSSSAGLTGTLTLDAQNNPDAVFVFQIGSTLTTASGSSVEVINAPPDFCNKFWQVGSSATLGTDSVFQGTIIASESITLNNGASLYGRALALNGAVALEDNRVTVPCRADSSPVSPPFTLEIFKFNDLNENGVYDPPIETPLADWNYTITGPGSYSSSGDTDEDGFIVKTDLAVGDYTVTETVQTGWTVTTANDQIVTVYTSHGERAVFGNYKAPLPPPPTPTPTPGGGGEAVGIEVYPANKLAIMAPWVGLAVAALIGGIILTMKRRETR